MGGLAVCILLPHRLRPIHHGLPPNTTADRDFDAVTASPGRFTHISSPVKYKSLHDSVKEHWMGLTPEQHKASLLADIEKPDRSHRRNGAVKRLAYYYPEALVR